jgi:hypothetical protein
MFHWTNKNPEKTASSEVVFYAVFILQVKFPSLVKDILMSLMMPSSLAKGYDPLYPSS